MHSSHALVLVFVLFVCRLYLYSGLLPLTFKKTTALALALAFTFAIAIAFGWTP